MLAKTSADLTLKDLTLKDLIEAAIREDMPTGDLTTDSMALAPRYGQARLVAKEDIILSGVEAFEQTMMILEPGCKVQWHFNEGDRILKKQIICHISGDLLQILKAERVALNFLGHLSGIATMTHKFVKEIEGTKTRLLDTRKTTPAFRSLEKHAVAHGGGHNHRWNLSDAILVKENHITVGGGITATVQRIRENSKSKIEVECSTLDEVREAVSLNVERILLDNMSNETLTEALKLVPARIETEASGNMNLARVRSVAELGVTYISVGAITHSAPTADVSLLFDWKTSTEHGPQ